jgi:endonuclease YncB( thermonuclease family)
MKPGNFILLLLLLLFRFTPWARGTELLEVVGKVTKVKDGNNLIIHDTRGFTQVVRLWATDAPELIQPQGMAAHNWLIKKTRDKQVRLVHCYVDIQGRTLGMLYIGDEWLNLEMIEAGLAWACDLDNEFPKLGAAQARARAAKKGLWSSDRPIPPWHYRSGVRIWREELEKIMPPRPPRLRSTNEPQTIGAH